MDEQPLNRDPSSMKRAGIFFIAAFVLGFLFLAVFGKRYYWNIDEGSLRDSWTGKLYYRSGDTWR